MLFQCATRLLWAGLSITTSASRGACAEQPGLSAIANRIISRKSTVTLPRSSTRALALGDADLPVARRRGIAVFLLLLASSVPAAYAAEPACAAHKSFAVAVHGGAISEEVPDNGRLAFMKGALETA